MSGYSNTDHDLSKGVKASHIGPETGDTADATTGGESGAGTRQEGSPPEAAGIGTTANQFSRAIPGHEERSFEGKDRGDIGGKDEESPAQRTPGTSSPD